MEKYGHQKMQSYKIKKEMIKQMKKETKRVRIKINK